MRRLVRLAALCSAAAIAGACSHDKTPQRTAGAAADLSLANAPKRTVRLNPDELTESKPLTLMPRRVASTPRAPASAPSAAPAAPTHLTGSLPDGQLPGLDTVMSRRGVALSAAAVVAKAAPLAPIGLPGVPGAQLNYDRGGFHLTPGGTPAGVVIRGGSVGDDHCDPTPRRGLFGGLFGGIFGNGQGMASGRTTP